MKVISIFNGARLVSGFSLLLFLSTAVFSQYSEQLNQSKIKFAPVSEFSGSLYPTRPRIFVAPKISSPEPAKSPINESKKVSGSTAVLELEKKAFDLLNKRRMENGLQPVVWNDDVARVARIHSQNMANNNFFSHKGLDGLMVDERADSNGIRNWQRIGENIAYNRGYDDPVEFAVLRWMQSQSHRENLLSNKWKETGVGVALAADGKTYYFTQVFVVRKQ